MNLNIKSAEAHKMAVQLAKQTNSSITAAVTEAIRRELRRTRDNTDRIKRIDKITKEMAKVMEGSPPAIHATDFLYDDAGVPK